MSERGESILKHVATAIVERDDRFALGVVMWLQQLGERGWSKASELELLQLAREAFAGDVEEGVECVRGRTGDAMINKHGDTSSDKPALGGAQKNSPVKPTEHRL